MSTRPVLPRRRGERGNVFNILMVGIAMSGALSVALFQLMGGPATSTVLLARGTASASGAQLAARALIADAMNQPDPDCDNDGAIEPRPWRGTNAALGAGYIPLASGAPVTDAWGTDFGYCVWDVGPLNDPATDNGCDDAGGNNYRLEGTAAATTDKATLQTVMAVVSAGPDKTFGTVCRGFTAADADDGSGASPADDVLYKDSTNGASVDDIIVRYTYVEASGATSELWSLKEDEPDTASILKEIEVGDGSTTGDVQATSVETVGKIVTGAAVKVGYATVCDPGHAGLLRYDSGGTDAIQYCDGSTWQDVEATEVGGTGGGDSACCIDELMDAEADYDSQDFIYMGTADGGADGSTFPDIEGQVENNMGVTAAGVGAAESITSGSQNTAAGHNALNVATTGRKHTAFGAGALASATTATGTPIDIVNSPQTYMEATEATTDIQSYTTVGNGNTLIAVVATNRSSAGATDVQLTDVADDGGGSYDSWTVAGNSPATVCASTRGDVGIWYKHGVTAGTFNVRATANADTRFTWTIYEVSGLDNAAPEVTASTRHTSTVTAVAATASAAPSQENGLAIAGMLDCSTGSNTITANQSPSIPLGGWTETVNVGTGSSVGVNASVAHALLSSASETPSQLWAMTSAAQASAHIAVFKGTSAVVYPGANTAVGKDALAAMTSGYYNTGIGAGALAAATTDLYNTAIGYEALLSLEDGPTTSSQNFTAIGYRALQGMDDESASVAIGYESQALPTLADTARAGTSLGYRAAKSITGQSASWVTAIGHQAGMLSAEGCEVCVGSSAGYGETADGDATAFGASAQLGEIGDHSTAFGSNTQMASTSSVNNTAFGAYAQSANTGADNTAFGARAMEDNVAGAGSVAVGAHALNSNASAGGGSTAVGAYALASGAAVEYSTAVGYQALMNHTGAANPATAVGYQALKMNTSGAGLSAMGYQALVQNTTGSRNTAAGAFALANNTAGNDNTAAGARALQSNTQGSHNTAAGYQALANNNGAGISVVQMAPEVRLAGSLKSFNITFDEEPQAGNTIIVVSTCPDTGEADPDDITDTQGGVSGSYDLAVQGPSGGAIYIFYRSAISAPSGTFTINVPCNTTTGAVATALEVSGLATSSVVDQTRSGVVWLGNTSYTLASSVAIAQADELAISGLWNNSGNEVNLGIQTEHADGWHEFLSENDNSAADLGTSFVYKLTNSAAVVNHTWTFKENTDNGKAILATFRGASASLTNFGERNTAAGYQVMFNNTVGDDNVAMGHKVLFSNTVGRRNTAGGYQAMYSNMSGSENVAMGYLAMFSNITGEKNTAAGHRAMYSNINGDRNAAMGAYAMEDNISGHDNVAMGIYALHDNTAGRGSVAVGIHALETSDVDGPVTGNTAIGDSALADELHGMGNTAIGKDALAVSATDLGAAAGIAVEQVLPIVREGSAFGTSSGSFSTAPDAGNTVIVIVHASSEVLDEADISDNQGGAGQYRLAHRYTTVGIKSHIFYRSNIPETDGTFTVSVESSGSATQATWSALEVSGLNRDDPVLSVHGNLVWSPATSSSIAPSSDTRENWLVVAGVAVDSNNTLNNVNIQEEGDWTEFAVENDDVAYLPVSYIYKVLTAMADEDHVWTHTAAVANKGNTIFVVFRGRAEDPGEYTYNTAFGVSALAATTTGTHNTAVGHEALAVNATGSYNTAVGYQAGPSSGATDCSGGPCTGLYNATAIGAGAVVTASNTIRIGDANVTEISGQVAWSATSDLRRKKDIVNSDLALDFIMRLRPVSYRLIKGNGRLDYGFIAQEVEEALEGRATNMVIQDSDPMRTYRLRNADLIAPLVRAIQQQREAELAQQGEIEKLQARLARVKAALAKRDGKEAAP